ncbi:Ras GTPase-activating protein-binding protein 1 [Xenoophorus captivus]|uniref:Ras GTPase-activating protein-binding protein 1 n=1 Tax=Xenoophorus captivus TaxID=1517983 RepID=A0ABV0QW07_9TELE
MIRYPDAHQLFVGNVPHDVDKTELKEFFERVKMPPSLPEYGNVLELRINSGGKLPNFGFVVFDDSEPVQKILSNRVRNPLFKLQLLVGGLSVEFWLLHVPIYIHLLSPPAHQVQR